MNYHDGGITAPNEEMVDKMSNPPSQPSPSPPDARKKVLVGLGFVLLAIVAIVAVGFALGLGSNSGTSNQLTTSSLTAIMPNATQGYNDWTSFDQQNVTTTVNLGLPSLNIVVSNALVRTFNATVNTSQSIGTFVCNVTIYLFNYPNVTIANSEAKTLEMIAQANGGYTVIGTGITNPSTPFVYCTVNSTNGSSAYAFGAMRNTFYIITEKDSNLVVYNDPLVLWLITLGTNYIPTNNNETLYYS